MISGKPKFNETRDATARLVARQVGSDRPAGPWTEITTGGPPYRMLWCRITEGAPADPPDERYYGQEVRPTGPDSGGHLLWEAVPGGVTQAVIHNMAEATAGTHRLAVGTVLRVEERLDRSGPPERVYLADVPPTGARLARILSYADGVYVVQPVRGDAGSFVDDGPPLGGVPNLGELWPAEAGYLAGPAGFDRYVPIHRTPAGWTIVLHPPRLV
jgi:hypothetical protein